MTRPIVYFFMRWSMCGESGWFASSGDVEGGIYRCDVNVALASVIFIRYKDIFLLEGFAGDDLSWPPVVFCSLEWSYS